MPFDPHRLEFTTGKDDVLNAPSTHRPLAGDVNDHSFKTGSSTKVAS